MTLRTGKSGKYRYYTCCTKARQGETGCKGRTVPMEKLDSVVAEHIEQRLLQPKRLEQILSAVLHRRKERAERRTAHIAELRKRGSESEAKLKRLYDAIENGIADVSDPMLKELVTDLKSIRDLARADGERAEGALDRLGPSIAEHYTASTQNLRQPGPQAHEDRERRLPSRPPPRAGPAHRSRRERSSHHGVEKRAPAHARRGFQRKNGRFWSAQFCTEVAHPTRFERVTFASGEQRSIQLSYGCVPLPLADWGAAARRTGLSRTPKGSFGQCHRSEIRRMAGEAGEGRSAACQLARHHWPGRGQAEKPGWVRSVGPANANRWPADRHDRPAKPWLRHSRDTQSGETAAVPPQWHHLAAPRRTSPADCRSA